MFSAFNEVLFLFLIFLQINYINVNVFAPDKSNTFTEKMRLF